MNFYKNVINWCLHPEKVSKIMIGIIPVVIIISIFDTFFVGYNFLVSLAISIITVEVYLSACYIYKWPSGEIK